MCGTFHQETDFDSLNTPAFVGGGAIGVCDQAGENKVIRLQVEKIRFTLISMDKHKTKNNPS